MNGNAKKLAVLVMIVALAIVLPVAMVSADDHAGKKFLQGTYAVTGMNGVLLAPFGFDPQTFEPINGVAFPVGPQSWKGTYTFHKDGTVDMDVIQAGVDPAIPSVPLTASSLHGTAELYYTLADRGKITFTVVHGTAKNTPLTGPPSNSVIYYDTNGSWDGVISPDGNSMQVTWGAPLILFMTDEDYNPTGPQFIAIGSFTLFRLND
jgi:hypothetical protein